MRQVCIDNRMYDLKTLKDVPEEFRHHRIKESIMLYTQGFFGKIFCQHINADQTEIRYTVYRTKVDYMYSVEEKEQYLGIYLTLKNDFSFSDDRIGDIIFKETQCNLLYLPFTDTSFHFQKDKESVTLEVLYSLEDIKQQVILFPSAKRVIAKLKTGTAFSLYQRPHTISFAVREIVNCILYSGFQGDLQKAYLKMKAKELLLQILALPTVKQHVSEKLNESTVDVLHEAKKFIEANYQQHYSITKMGRRFGMNTTSFKKGFRQEFAMGPFELLIKIRMAKAIELLKERRVAVNQIADATGYKSVGSFIKAFKKQFHYTPGQMRKTFI